MRNLACRAACLLACLLPFLALPAIAEDSADDSAYGPVEPFVWLDGTPVDSIDYADLVLHLDLDDVEFRKRDVVSLWTDLAAGGRRMGGDELRLDWTPVTDRVISRRNRMANFKPSTGLGVDFDAPSESVVLEWRIGF